MSNTHTLPLWLGVDGGSTTVKLSVYDTSSRSVLFSQYERHDGEPRTRLVNMLTALKAQYGDRLVLPIFTGSQCRPFADVCDAVYVQEVIAGSLAVQHGNPGVRTVIELGGQDAKIIFFSGDGSSVSDMRMNGVCAGGTGAFIDQMAALLSVEPEDFNGLAAKGSKVYEVSGRCGVFAKTDIQPLLNQGVSREDIALSCFHALARQTIGGLAQGMSIHPQVLLAGGPFSFNPVLRRVFCELLSLPEDQVFLPDDPACFVALGAALAGGSELAAKAVPRRIDVLLEALQKASDKGANADGTAMRSGSFFQAAEARQAFEEQYRLPEFQESLTERGGTIPVWIGLDAGSTTTKFVVIDEAGEVLYTFYRQNGGKPLETARDGLLALFETCNSKGTKLVVRGFGTTGYGEELFAAAFGADFHTVETIAHKEAACRFSPEVSFILDVGGQDMKAIYVNNGIITNIILNEACSAGCGSFIETYARSLGVEAPQIAGLAFGANEYPFLGSRCTVFMNSSIITEQKQGRSRAAILGGVCRSVVENLFTKVLRVADPAELGKHIVVQGGTFRNDAVLKSFIDFVGHDVVRPRFCGEMGAYGVALLTKTHQQAIGLERQASATSVFIGQDGLAAFTFEALPASRCELCSNRCELRSVRFSDGSMHVTGNRCERGLPEQALHQKPAVAGALAVPDLWKERTKLLFRHSEFKPKTLKRSGTAPLRVGIPFVLDFFDTLPFWTTWLSSLGCTVVLSGTATPGMLASGLQDVSSDTVCLPAKIVHGHVATLKEKGVDRIFFPKMLKLLKEHPQADDSWNCAVVQGYPEVVRISEERRGGDSRLFMSPSFKWSNPLIRRRQLVAYAIKMFGVSKLQARLAMVRGDLAQSAFRRDLLHAGAKVLHDLKTRDGFAVVMAGRPYHADPFVSHGISEILTSMGIPVLVNDALPVEKKLDFSFSRMDTSNVFHTRLVAAARQVASNPKLELLQLVSFGCGHDAVLTDEIQRIVRTEGSKEVLSLKIDEGENIGPLRIRIRSFVETVRTRSEQQIVAGIKAVRKSHIFGVQFLKKDQKERTILLPRLSASFTELISHAFRKQGYKTQPLPTAGHREIELGKRFVHNDICYPAQINIGEILGFLQDHPRANTQYAAALAKNCNDCRAGQYAALGRKAFDNAGFNTVPIITTDIDDKKELHPGFKLDGLKFQMHMVKGLVLIDALDDMLRKTRPYELNAGETERIHAEELDKVLGALDHGFSKGRKVLESSIERFNTIAVDRSVRKPRVAIIGEILVNYHERGNHGVVAYLESHGMECVLPAMIEFWRQDVVNRSVASEHGHVLWSRLNRFLGSLTGAVFNFFIDRGEKSMQKFRWHEERADILSIAEKAKTITDISFKTGEGWLIPGEILTWIGKGIRSFLVVQPFGCLPNHITGRGVIAAIKRKYDDVQILPLDFDPDTSEANIQNRLQMLILSAREREARQARAQ